MLVSFEGNCDKGPEDTVEEDRFLWRGLLKRRRRRETQPVVIWSYHLHGQDRQVPLSSVFLDLKIIQRSMKRGKNRYKVNYGCHNKRTGTWLWRQLEISSEMFWGLQQGCKLSQGFDIKALKDDKQWSIRRTNKGMIKFPSGIISFWLYDIKELFKRHECMSKQNRKYCNMFWYHWFHCINVCAYIYTHTYAHMYNWQAKRFWMSNHPKQLHISHLFLKPKITGTDMYHWLCNSSNSRVFNYLVTADD